MFYNEEIKQNPDGSFSCRSVCTSAVKAEELRAGFTGPVRQISMFADLYCIGNHLILESYDKKTLLKLMNILNHSIEDF